MNLAIAPILIPLLTALAALLWGGNRRARRGFVALSAAAQLVVALWLMDLTIAQPAVVLGLGGWSARVGIVLVVDLLSAVMLTLSTIMALTIVLFGFAEISVQNEHPLRLPLLQFLVVGINLGFCTGDLFNLFVAFEIMLISSYALLTLEADNWDVRHAYPYVAINLVGSALFISAAGWPTACLAR